MSLGQWRKLDVVERVERGELTVSEGAQALGLSRRQLQRLRKKVRVDGPRGVLHGNSGRAPKHRTSDLVRSRIVQLWREKYVGFNDQHFTEKLGRGGGTPSRGTDCAAHAATRRHGICTPHAVRCKHRGRRDRRAQAGQMILWDGRRHDWLEGRGPWLCLMGLSTTRRGSCCQGLISPRGSARWATSGSFATSSARRACRRGPTWIGTAD